ncbi:MAG: acylphosphatase [Thermoflexales bacterium]|nr:acylphosphatase [Thermoflexales bacterium]MCS7324430.1 acylphosphatase [Thermoflexales bacterium]MCX7939513.1 acylphosphatase [Thermoflexales bacterium]MDW8054987.1 acylphosphatase [Anaerolineae bacterium]MDW8293383.1 acylphosphatase [Anaerolineae bacterium]
MSNEQRQLHAIVHGVVQGVNFRYSTQREAQRLGVTGWVRNLPDGTVEVLAEGTQPALEALLSFLHKGPPAARVTHVEVRWGTASGRFVRFEIR